MKKKTSMVTTGITSLFLIFVVLSLAILSLLSLGNSRADRAMSLASLQATVEYYQATSKSADFRAAVDRILLDNSEAKDYDKVIQEIKIIDPDIVIDEKTNQLTSLIPVSEELDLEVVLQLPDLPLADSSEAGEFIEAVEQSQADSSEAEEFFEAAEQPQMDSSKEKEAGLAKLISFRTRPSGEWNPDLSQNLLIR